VVAGKKEAKQRDPTRYKNKLETLRDFIQVKLPMRPVSRVAAREPSARAHRVPAACRQVVGLQVWIARGSIGMALDRCSSQFFSQRISMLMSEPARSGDTTSSLCTRGEFVRQHPPPSGYIKNHVYTFKI
jgi:hypothetical protein